jgi:hypothetical protein
MAHLTVLPCPLVRHGSHRDAAHHKGSATPRVVKGARPPVTRGGPPRVIKWVIISDLWYTASSGGA